MSGAVSPVPHAARQLSACGSVMSVKMAAMASTCLFKSTWATGSIPPQQRFFALQSDFHADRRRLVFQALSAADTCAASPLAARRSELAADSTKEGRQHLGERFVGQKQMVLLDSTQNPCRAVLENAASHCWERCMLP
jgi:hypothetical protein